MDGFILRTVQGLRNKLGHEKIFPLMTNLRGTMFLIAPNQDLSAAGATFYVRNHPWRKGPNLGHAPSINSGNSSQSRDPPYTQGNVGDGGRSKVGPTTGRSSGQTPARSKEVPSRLSSDGGIVGKEVWGGKENGVKRNPRKKSMRTKTITRIFDENAGKSRSRQNCS